MNQYKGAVTRWCKANNHAAFAWQARYFEQIIRTEPSLVRIREYIAVNPMKWVCDQAEQPGTWI